MKQVVLYLVGHHARWPGHGIRGLHFRQGEVADPDKSYFSRFYQVLHRPYGLFHGNIGIGEVDLVQVQVVRLQVLQGAFNRQGNPLCRVIPRIEFAGQEYFVPDSLDSLASHFLTVASAVHLGGVDKIKPQVDSEPEHVNPVPVPFSGGVGVAACPSRTLG